MNNSRLIYYTGIGSRNTDSSTLRIMEKLGFHLAKKGFILRSGGADGADMAFERGCDRGGGHKEIYLPWKGFNNNNSNLYTICPKAIEIAWEYHPNYYKLSEGAQKLMARNSYQLLGSNLKTKSEFVICYTTDGKDSGGTGQSIRISEAKKIKVFNLFFKEQLQALKDFVMDIKSDPSNF
jgi:hypothetical protein